MSKLVHILYSGLGGHGAVLFALLEGKFLAETEHHVIFVGVEQPRGEFIKRCEALQISWSYIARNRDESYLRFVINLFRRLLVVDSRMIFAHGLAAIPSLALYRLFSRRKELLVLRETQAHHLKSHREWFFLVLANAIFDRIVYLTDEARTGAKAKLGIFHRDANATVIGNGLDTDYFSCIGRPATGCKEVKIGMQSRLQANKDHGTLIEAFHKLCSLHKGVSLSLHIAGDGDTMSALKHQVDSLRLSDKVFFHGMLEQDDLHRFLSELTVYVHSTHGETMSTAIMQAMSMGLPIIAADVWGVSNMIRNGNGLLYRPGNSSDLANKIKAVLEDGELAISLSSRARQDAETEYGNAAMVKRYMKLFAVHG